MSKQTFKEFLREFDRSDLQLQRQVADKKADQHAYRDQGQQDFDQLKQQRQNPNRPKKGDIIVGKNGAQFRVTSDKAVKGKDGWKLPLMDLATKRETWTDYNREFAPTGEETDLGKRYFKAA